MKYGSVLPEGFNVPKSAFWLKADLEKRNPFDQVVIQPGDIVMDCGAFIGTFTAAAMEQGAASAVCYEAAPKNAALLRNNVSRYPTVHVFEKALTADKVTSVELTMSGFSGANSILPSPNRLKVIEVRAAHFRTELLFFKPQVLKIDIEGAEYALLASLQSSDLSSVRHLFIEFHPIEEREAKIAQIRAFIKAEGFSILSARNRAFVAAKE